MPKPTGTPATAPGLPVAGSLHRVPQPVQQVAGTSKMRTIIEEGVSKGQCGPRDERLAALPVIGICNRVAWWFRPGSVRSPLTTRARHGPAETVRVPRTVSPARSE